MTLAEHLIEVLRPMCAVRGCLRQDALYRINPTGPGRDFEGMCPEHYQELVEASRGGEE